MILFFTKSAIDSDVLVKEIKAQFSSFMYLTFEDGTVACEFSDFVDATLLENIINNHDSSKTIPIPITPLQLRVGLIKNNIDFSEIENQISLLSEPSRSLAAVAWEYSLSFERLNPLVAAIGSALNYNDQQLDDFWRSCSEI